MKQKGLPRQAGLAPILIIVLIAVAIAGGYLVYNYVGFCGKNCINEKGVFTNSALSQQTPQPTSIPSSSPSSTPNSTVESSISAETANWKTYTNNEYGISFKYPTNYIIQDDPEGMIDVSVSQAKLNDKKYEYLTINYILSRIILPSGNWKQVIQDAVNQEKQNNPNFQVRITDNTATVTNVPFDSTNLQDQQHYYKVVFWKYKNSAIVTRYGNVGGNEAIVYDQILSTLKLTDRVIPSDWKIYKNSDYNFSFKYPSRFSVNEEKNTRKFMSTQIPETDYNLTFTTGKIVKGHTDYSGLGFFIHQSNNQTIAQEYKDAQSIDKISNTQGADEAANIGYYMTSPFPVFRVKNTFIEFVVSRESLTASLDDNIQKYTDEILSTFKFTN